MICQAESFAAHRYTRRTFIAMLAYIVVLVACDYAIRNAMVAGSARYALAALPAIPVLAVFVALGRYLIEEGDEYLRAQMIRQILYATGMMLASATIWGMLTALAEVRPLVHAPVLWFGCFGLAAIILRFEQR